MLWTAIKSLCKKHGNVLLFPGFYVFILLYSWIGDVWCFRNYVLCVFCTMGVFVWTHSHTHIIRVYKFGTASKYSHLMQRDQRNIKPYRIPGRTYFVMKSNASCWKSVQFHWMEMLKYHTQLFPWPAMTSHAFDKWLAVKIHAVHSTVK